MIPKITISTQPEQLLYGIQGSSGDKTIAKDIPTLSKRYRTILDDPSLDAFPFMVLTKNYDETIGAFDLFVGGTIENDQLEAMVLPEGTYGTITVKPKLGFMWGPAIGEAKRYFYTKWLPTSGYEAVNLEYELHTEKSVDKKPEIDILFALK